MAATPYSLHVNWDATNRITATGDTDVNVTNTGNNMVRWTLTNSDDLPTISPSQAGIIKSQMDKPMTIPNGQRLWLAGLGATATVEE